ncbi:MAG: hypothetical protein ABR571_03490 [Jatrophihabitans sp.]|uniref:DUF6841 family protein n=1 Tax=Jatrophihabitans sp. TaxID=1932789 RepID=UPI0039108FD6
MDESDVRRWFGEYLDVFAAAGRGERDAAHLLAYYGVPLLVATDDGFTALRTDDEVLTFAAQQIDGVRTVGYHHSDVLHTEVTICNVRSVLLDGVFSRRRSDGSEIGRVAVSYLVTDGPDGRRISAMLLRSQ